MSGCADVWPVPRDQDDLPVATVPAMASAFPLPAVGRTFRVVENPGRPHPCLDHEYESAEEAWLDALRWWQGCGGDPTRTCTLGVEATTAGGEWRTLRLQACSGRSMKCCPSAPSP